AVSPELGGPEGVQLVATLPDPDPPNQVKVATPSPPVSLSEAILRSLDPLVQRRRDRWDQFNGRPDCRSRASGWSSLTSPWGFPCCVRFPCAHAAATTPVQRLGVVFAHRTQPYQPSPKGSSGRPAHRPFRGLLGVHSRCGPHTRAVTYT